MKFCSRVGRGDGNRCMIWLDTGLKLGDASQKCYLAKGGGVSEKLCKFHNLYKIVSQKYPSLLERLQLASSK